MRTVEEIQSAIEKLSREEYWQLVAWMDDHRNEVWDKEMEADSAAGLLDKLFKEADAQIDGRDFRPL